MSVEVATVFGAAKREQRVTEAPSSVTIVTAAGHPHVRLEDAGRDADQRPRLLRDQRSELVVRGRPRLQPPQRLQQPHPGPGQRPSVQRQRLRPGPDRPRVPDRRCVRVAASAAASPASTSAASTPTASVRAMDAAAPRASTPCCRVASELRRAEPAVFPRIRRAGLRLRVQPRCRCRVGDQLTHVNLNVTPPQRALSIGARVSNLFDTAYAHPVGLEFRQDVIPQDGRGISVRATLRV